MDKYLKEIFAPPVNLKPAYTLNDMTFYSSDSLKEKYVLAFKKSSKGRDIANEIEKLVNKESIIPCYKSKNLLSFIKHKLSRSTSKYIMAFYIVDDKKVIVLIDNSANVFGSSSNNEIASTSIHECMHMVAGKKLSQFITIFYPKLIDFYTEFFKDYLVIDSIDKKQIASYIKFIIPFEKKGPEYTNTKLSSLFKLLDSLFALDSQLQDKEFIKRLTDLMVASKLFIINVQSFINNSKYFNLIFTSLNKAYLNAFGKKNIYTMPMQEIFSMSEIACVFSEMNPQDPIIKKLFKIII